MKNNVGKKVLILIMSLCLILASFSVLAISNNINIIQNQNDAKKLEVENLLEEAQINIDDSNNALKEIVELFSFVKYEMYKNENALFNVGVFFSVNEKYKTNQEYQINKWSLLSKRRASLGFQITEDQVENSIKKISINSDGSINVDVDETYSHLTNQEGQIGKSYVTYNLTYTFIIEDSKWKISNLYSNDEFDKLYFNEEINVAQRLIELNNSVNLEAKKADLNSPESIREFEEINHQLLRGSWHTTSFTRSYANTYASNYWSSSNSNFYEYSSDCQNFASQCIWYAFGGTNTSASIESRVVPMMYNTTDSRDWFQCDGYYECDSSYRWVNVDNFADYLSSSFSTSGPRGWYNSELV